MSDSTADETSEVEGGRLARLLKQRRMLLLAGVVLCVLGLAVGGWFGLSGMGASKQADHGAAAQAGAEHGGDAAAAASQLALLDFKNLIVNLTGSAADGSPSARILNIQLSMAYDDNAQNEALMKKKQPYLRDAILSYLRQLHEADLRGSDGLFLLKAELLKRARAVVGSDAPKEFLIVGLVMQ